MGEAVASDDRPHGPFARVRTYVRFTRPFTLLPPLLGVVSGAITAWGSASNPHVLAGPTLESIGWAFTP